MLTNPIITGFHPDPCICRNGDDFYIATSTFEWFPGVRIFHSKDLKNWRLAAMPLNTPRMLEMKGNPDSGGIWAPALSYSDGLFWLLYTDVKVIDAPWKNGRNFLTTANNIEGPWSDPVPMGNGGFDPSLFHDDDGHKYYVYRSWGPRHHSDPINKIMVQRFHTAAQKLENERHCIFEGTEFKYTEAPHIYKKDNYYYLLTAEGGTSFEHRVTVARAKNLLGPYELSPHGPLISAWQDPNNPLQKAGHGSLVATKNDEWFVAYLASRPLKFPGRPRLARWGRGVCPLGRETAIDRIEWQKGWPLTMGGPQPKSAIPPANLPEHTWSKESTDGADFTDHFPATTNPITGTPLNHHWQTLRIPFDEKIGSLTARPGYLRLFGRDSLLSLFEQSTVATRWRHHRFSAQVKMDFTPRNFQQSAGLCCYYNTSNWTYCCVDFDEDLQRPCLRLIQVDKQQAHFFLYEEDAIALPEKQGTLWLRVDVQDLDYGYSYSLDGEQWHALSPSFASWKISDDYIDGRGFFTGAFVGLHCADISGDGCHADFSDFSYRAASNRVEPQELKD